MTFIETYRELLRGCETPDYRRFLQAARVVDSATQASYMQPKRGKFPFLKRMRSLLKLINYEESWFEQVVLVGGTYAKGTVTAHLQALAHSTGSTGAFLSPSVLSWCETVLTAPSQPITPRRLAEIYHSLLAAANEVGRLPHGGPSHFECMLATALIAGRDAGCKRMILEVGCGGADDATNAIPHQAAVITGVGEDHMPLLGNTLEEVAKTKAGIIPEGGTLFTAETDEKLLRLFAKECDKRHAAYYVFSPISDPEHYEAGNAALARAVAGQLFGAEEDGERLAPLPGRYDLLFVEQLPRLRRFLGGAAPAAAASPLLAIDGAHNRDKCAALVARLRADGIRSTVTVLALKSDKDVESIAHTLEPISRSFILIACEGELGEQTLPVTELQRRLTAAVKKPVTVANDMTQAMRTAVEALQPGDALLATGSFLLVREVWRWLLEEK